MGNTKDRVREYIDYHMQELRLVGGLLLIALVSGLAAGAVGSGSRVELPQVNVKAIVAFLGDDISDPGQKKADPLAPAPLGKGQSLDLQGGDIFQSP